MLAVEGCDLLSDLIFKFVLTTIAVIAVEADSCDLLSDLIFKFVLTTVLFFLWVGISCDLLSDLIFKFVLTTYTLRNAMQEADLCLWPDVPRRPWDRRAVARPGPTEPGGVVAVRRPGAVPQATRSEPALDTSWGCPGSDRGRWATAHPGIWGGDLRSPRPPVNRKRC